MCDATIPFVRYEPSATELWRQPTCTRSIGWKIKESSVWHGWQIQRLSCAASYSQHELPVRWRTWWLGLPTRDTFRENGCYSSILDILYSAPHLRHMRNEIERFLEITSRCVPCDS